MNSSSPAQLITYLRKTVPDAVIPAFEQAMNLVEQQLDDLANAASDSAERDFYDKDSIFLHSAKRSLCLKARNKLIESIENLLRHEDIKKVKLNLSLIGDEQMQMHLACEKLVERFNHDHRKGVKALDMRISKALEVPNLLGVRMPLSPHVLADSVRTTLDDANLSEPAKAMIVVQYELFLDPVLSDLLKAANTALAQAGVLPNLIVQDEEERIRRQSLVVPGAAAKRDDSKLSLSNEIAPEENLDAEDRALFAELLAQVKNQRAEAASQANIISALTQANMQGSAAPRQMAKADTLSILNSLQHSNPQQVMDALTRGDGSIAETIKREMVKNAHVMGIQQGNEQVGMAQEEETAVDLASNMFEMMLKGRQADDTVSPMLSRMMMPFMKAAVIDPQLFEERQHPARELLNTISEACEDNFGETPQDRELLGHVEKAVSRINEEFVDDLSKFEDVSKELSKQMETHRKRVQLSEKRAADAQRGQERLEMARTQANAVVTKAKQEYDYPPELINFFSNAWQHHLSMTALRKGEDSDDYAKASGFAKHWINLLDMLSLGEPLSSHVIDTLQLNTSEVLSNSGIFDPEAQTQFKNLMEAVQRWSEQPEPPAIEAMAPVIEQPVAAEPVSIVKTTIPPSTNTINTEVAESNTISATAVPNEPPAQSIAVPQAALVQAPEQKASSPTTAAEILAHAASADETPITEEELKEMRALEVGVWLQVPKADGGVQKLKIGWISGISGLMMMVNRRGARVLALSPEELVRYKRRDELTIFEREAAVDQALVQLLNQYKKQ